MSTERGNYRLITVHAPVPTRVAHWAFIALQKFHAEALSQTFLRIPTQHFVFVSSPKKQTHTVCNNRPNIVDLSYILVWRDSKKRCVHCNYPIVRSFGRHSCLARATAICILYIVESFRSYLTIEEK